MSPHVAAAPARSASESPGYTHQAGHSEAMIIACVLAEYAGPLGGLSLVSDEHVRTLVERQREKWSDSHILAWRQRVDPDMWSIRWDKARELVARVYDELPGAKTLPDIYNADFQLTPSAASA